MTKERRQSPRLNVSLPARWEGVVAQQSATVTNLSETGCFVLTGGKVEPRELIRLEIELPHVEPVCFWSEVVEEAYEIGFAVRFTSGDADDNRRLNAFIASELSRQVSS